MRWDLDEVRNSLRPRRTRNVAAASKPLMVIHVGTHKTGTTSIQHYFAGHRGSLRRAGFVYPESGIYGEQHAGLPASYMTQHPIVPERLLERDADHLIQELRSEVPQGFNVLLSSEVFWELLTYLAWHFHDLHERLSQTWDVHYLYMMRDPHKKTWSAVKHMAREGMVFDPVATYAGDLNLTVGTEAALVSAHPDSVRIEYDGRDSVGQLLAFIMSDPIVKASRMTDEEWAYLARMRQRRTPEAGDRRINQNHSNPHSAAVTLSVTESLRTAHGIDPKGLAEFPRLYNALFSDSRLSWTDLDLPDDRVMHSRLRRAVEEGGPIITEGEMRSVRNRLADPGTRQRAVVKRCSNGLVTALAALDQRLAHPVQP